MTRWAKEVTVDNVHPEYPRPAMVRENWLNLNGQWDYAIQPADLPQPKTWQGKILVPFAVESALSGVMKRVSSAERLWYRRTFTVPSTWSDRRILLHFGAVDWHAIVWVNGQEIGEHKGCYDPFTFDITDALKQSGDQQIVISVWDPTDEGTQPRGKQVTNPKGIYYTPVTGIWQTVWIEPVPQAYIKSLKIVPDIDQNCVWVTADVGEFGTDTFLHAEATLPPITPGEEGGKTGFWGPPTKPLRISLAKNPETRLWSPDSPYLYDLRVTLHESPKPKGPQSFTTLRVIDSVKSYFGMRNISIAKDQHGFNRLMLNNHQLFQFGPLDQGWWPDGLYTAPTDEALKYDIEITKKLGFNMLRKHVKIEPARFYYHCDKLGILVWQDMPNGNGPRTLRVNSSATEDAKRDGESAKQFETELKAMIDNLHNHPSIVTWVVFNEGWGQYDTKRLADWTKKYDPTRICNATSCWTDRGVSDMLDAHMYPGPGMEDAAPPRVTVLGEFGGLGLPVKGHLWLDKGSWGYRSFETKEALAEKYQSLIKSLYGLLGRGLAAAVYTQTTDVESEVNGLMTYDREVLKFDPATTAKLHQPLYGPVAKAITLLEDSEHKKQKWQYSLQLPDSDWATQRFRDKDWKQSAAPFAKKANYYFAMGTQWNEKNLWLRKTFVVQKLPRDLRLKVYYDVADAVIFLNGKKIKELKGRSKRHYEHIDISQHANLLHRGQNIVAVHCWADPDRRMQAFDLGLYAVDY